MNESRTPLFSCKLTTVHYCTLLYLPSLHVYGLVANRQSYSALQLFAWLVGCMQGDVSDHQTRAVRVCSHPHA